MGDDRWVKLKAVFLQALEADPGERESVATRHCAGDAALLAEVLDLLRSHDEAATFMETPAMTPAARPGADVPLAFGSGIGPYRLANEIGRGGMGTVYLAVRADGAFDRRVAIKIVRPGPDAERIIARFQHERETLASLDHPNIARLLDAGATDDGRPYFVMEHVDGTPIDRYCDSHQLGIPARLALFRTLCSAVHSAHQHLVVHRDLKPDNILVTADGTPKLVDFGIAKVLGESGEARRVTGPAEQLLTPDYASPEQVDGRPVTTASDVYSLGVLLFELLTGRNPTALGRRDRSARGGPRRADITVAPSAVVELPLDPSVEDGEPRADTAETLSRCRGVSPEALRRQLAGDLDTIVSVAMRVDPARRYASVEHLSEDVRRHLERLPIVARKDALGYRMTRFVARHRPAVAASLALLAGLVAAVAMIVWQGRVAAQQRDLATLEGEKARRLSEFLQDMLQAPDPINEGRDVRMADVLDRAARRLDAGTLGTPAVIAPIRQALGVTYYRLGVYDAAEKQLRAALSASGGATPEAKAGRARVESLLADVVSSAGDAAAAERMYLHALAVFDELGLREDARRADALNAYGQLLRDRGDDAGAESRYREALAIRRRLLGDGDVAVAESLNNLAVVRHAKNDFAGAERLYRESLGIMRRASGDNHPGVAEVLTNLATVVSSQGNLAAAEPLYAEALDLKRRLLGSDHPSVSFTMYAYADALQALGKHDAAIGLCRDVLSRRGRSLPPGHPLVPACLLILGKSLVEKGQFRAAEDALRESVALRRAALPAGHWQLASARSALGRCLAAEGRFEEAERLLVESFETLSADRGPNHERTRDALANLVQLYEAWGKPRAAATYRARAPR